MDPRTLGKVDFQETFGGSSQNYYRFEEDKMEIGNVERRKEVNQRQKDRINNACFTCNKKGCRPWLQKGGNHQQSCSGGQQRLRTNNLETGFSENL